MATLLETLKRTQQDQSLGPSDTARTQELLGAKTGKAVTERGPAISRIGELEARRQAGAAQQELGQRATLADVEAGQAEAAATAEFQQRQQALAQQERGLDQQLQLNSQKILNDLRRQGREVDTQRDALALAQLGQMQALQNKEYIANLEMEGQRRRLDDELTFKRELQESVFSDLSKMYRDRADFERDMAMSEADFMRKYQAADLNWARSVAAMEAESANRRALYEGLGGLVTSGLDAYNTYETSENKQRLATLMKREGYKDAEVMQATGYAPEEVED